MAGAISGERVIFPAPTRGDEVQDHSVCLLQVSKSTGPLRDLGLGSSPQALRLTFHVDPFPHDVLMMSVYMGFPPSLLDFSTFCFGFWLRRCWSFATHYMLHVLVLCFGLLSLSPPGGGPASSCSGLCSLHPSLSIVTLTYHCYFYPGNNPPGRRFCDS